MSNICSNCNDRPGLISQDGYCSSCQWVFEKGKAHAESLKEPIFTKVKTFFAVTLSLVISIAILIFGNVHKTEGFKSFACVLSGGNYISTYSENSYSFQSQSCVHITENLSDSLNREASTSSTESSNMNETGSSQTSTTLVKIDNLTSNCLQAIQPIRDIQKSYLSGLAIKENYLIDIINKALNNASDICLPDEYSIWYQNEYLSWVNNPNY